MIRSKKFFRRKTNMDIAFSFPCLSFLKSSFSLVGLSQSHLFMLHDIIYLLVDGQRAREHNKCKKHQHLIYFFYAPSSSLSVQFKALLNILLEMQSLAGYQRGILVSLGTLHRFLLNQPLVWRNLITIWLRNC